MKAIIITIGDEILFGQTIDTNSTWLANELDLMGIKVHEIISISDDETHIINTLSNATEKADMIIITGGLGPTDDDKTKSTLAKYFNTELTFHPEIYEEIIALFGKKKIAFLERNKQQAMLPANCIPLKNELGTAPGMWFYESNKVYVSLPGVPFEMKQIFTRKVIPRLKDTFLLPAISHRFILTAGYGESVLAEKLMEFEKKLPDNISMAYLPTLGMVKLRLTAKGNLKGELEQQLDEQVDFMKSYIDNVIFGYGRGNSLERVIGKWMSENNKTMATAESCTGGTISQRITSIPGSSAYFKGAVIAYSNEIKTNELDVSGEILNQFGAVSEETVTSMVSGLISRLDVDYGIAVSGIAGPDGGTPDKPVGTVWVAVGDRKHIRTKLLKLGKQREQNIKLSATFALNLLWRFIRS
jgi:competence/damage-inducible protein CinA-like protein